MRSLFVGENGKKSRKVVSSHGALALLPRRLLELGKKTSETLHTLRMENHFITYFSSNLHQIDYFVSILPFSL